MAAHPVLRHLMCVYTAQVCFLRTLSLRAIVPHQHLKQVQGVSLISAQSMPYHIEEHVR